MVSSAYRGVLRQTADRLNPQATLTPPAARRELAVLAAEDGLADGRHSDPLRHYRNLLDDLSRDSSLDDDTRAGQEDSVSQISGQGREPGGSHGSESIKKKI
eukprot:scaffold460984_cov27-Prasinocladus_malaysianus.AAC.1